MTHDTKNLAEHIYHHHSDGGGRGRGWHHIREDDIDSPRPYLNDTSPTMRYGCCKRRSLLVVRQSIRVGPCSQPIRNALAGAGQGGAGQGRAGQGGNGREAHTRCSLLCVSVFCPWRESRGTSWKLGVLINIHSGVLAKTIRMKTGSSVHDG